MFTFLVYLLTVLADSFVIVQRLWLVNGPMNLWLFSYKWEQLTWSKETQSSWLLRSMRFSNSLAWMILGLLLWNMCALLVQQDLLEALKGDSTFGRIMVEKDIIVLLEKAYNAIAMSISDKMLRKVSKEKIASRLWTKLESLCMMKSLINQLHLMYWQLEFK